MKYLVMTLLCLSLCASAFADQRTTVLTEQVKLNQAAVELPVIDGSNDTALEANANRLLRDTASSLAQQVGGGDVVYRVMLNRPSLVSMTLAANNNGKATQKSANIDLTTGKEFTLGDFFVQNDHFTALVGDTSDFVLTEEGVLLRTDGAGEYNKLVEYRDVLQDMRIGNAGRLLQVARLTEKSAGKTLTLEQPGLAALKLDSNPSTGYGWQLGTVNEHVKLVGSSFTMPNATDNRVGTPGVEIVFLAFDEPGTYEVKMEYKRAWERVSARNLVFTVVVNRP